MNDIKNMMWGVALSGVLLSGCGGGSNGGNEPGTQTPQPDAEAPASLRATFPAIGDTKALRSVPGELMGFVVIDGVDRVPLAIGDGDAEAEFELGVGQYDIHVIFEFFDEDRSTTWMLAVSPSRQVEVMVGQNAELTFEAANYSFDFDDDDDGIDNLTELENGTDPGTPDVAGPTGAVVDAHGNAITVVDLHDPVTLRAEGLLPNTAYTLRVIDPDGVEHNPPEGFTATTDEAGTLHDLTVVHNLDMSDVLSQATAQTGDHTIQVIGGEGMVVLIIGFTVEDVSRVVCVDAENIARASFWPEDEVFANIKAPDGTYNVYVLSDSNAVLKDGDLLVGEPFSAEVAEGSGFLSLGLYLSGSYDVVVDIDNNDVFDQAVDLISRHRRHHACFAVQTSGNNAEPITAQLCADRNGNHRNVFDPNVTAPNIRDMFAYTNADVRSESTSGVHKYVVQHQGDWRDGDSLTDVTAHVELNPAQLETTRDAPWLVWPRQQMQPGCYDVVIDVNRNGVFDLGIDYLDNTDTFGNVSCGCQVATASCEANVTIDSVANGDVVSTSAIVLEGEVAGDITGLGFVEIVAGQQANTVSIDTEGSAFSTDIPLFNGQNQVTTSFFYDDGSACSKTLTVTSAPVAPSQLIRAQLTWDGTTDVDLHLVRPGGQYVNGGGGEDDCNHRNCIVDAGEGNTNLIDWGVVGDESDDPILDVDCVSCDNGIENIWMNGINDDGLYTVYVDAYSDLPSDVTVKVFIRGVQVGEVSCNDMVRNTSTDTCRIGTIDWAGGSGGSGTFTPDGALAEDFPLPE